MRWLGLPSARERNRPLRDARTYDEWRAVALELDHQTGADAWRREPGSSSYDAALLEEHTDSLRSLREARRFVELATMLEEALYRHLGELSNPRLYQVALLGTKDLVERFFEEAEAALEVLSRPELTGIDTNRSRERLAVAARNFGRSALLLSGGASLGFFHLGVCKALFEQGLLPNVLSGASMGAMVACGIGSRTDDELRALFADLRAIRTDALRPLSPADAVRLGAMFDPKRLEEVIVHNNGDFTFAEAHARTGRTLGVSVSPTRERQKPRILSHVATPDVLLRSAALASSAVPGAFPSTGLQLRDSQGRESPFHGTERWIDGTFKGDVPTRRLGRLFNVNHFIVSQVNPHVAPVRRLTERRGLVPFAVDVATESVRVQLAHQLDVARRILARTPLRTPIELAHALADQDYGGDIDIHPRVRPVALARTLANISHAELEQHVLEGERSTWPLIARIRNETRIERALDAAQKRLEPPRG